jgi:hypothetical protein
MIYFSKNSLSEYVVQSGEEMRIDLVMMSIYNTPYSLPELDVILFINNIDNPLSINKGDIILYPPIEALSSYRYEFDDSAKAGENVRKVLAVPNKTTLKDPNRKKFLENGYVLPPTVLDVAKPPVRVEGDKIVVGGINN